MMTLENQNKFSLIQLFKKRIKYKLKNNNQEDKWIADILQTGKDVEYLITSDSLENQEVKDAITKIADADYYISGLFDCKNIFQNNNVFVGCIIFQKEKPDKVKLGSFISDLQLVSKSSNNLALKDMFNKDYLSYIDDINQWVNNDIKPANIETGYLFGEILYSQLDLNNLSPLEYLTKQITIDWSLAEKTEKLGDYADILTPKPLPDTNFKFDNLTVTCTTPIPFVQNNLSKGTLTTVELRENDILLRHNLSLDLYNKTDNINRPIYVAKLNQTVIRPKNNVNSKALYLKLKMLETLSPENINKNTLIPAFKETDDNIYEVLYGQKTFKAKLALLNELKKSEDLFKDNFLNELKSKIKKNQINKVISEDFKEIKICYASKAYKATLVLCGALLEAFLLDWIEEKKEKDPYLKNKVSIDLNDKNNRNLSGYIKIIAEIKRPEWIDEKEKANEIRKNRNYIHTSLCLREDCKIDAELCRDVISYLQDIIATRNHIKIDK